MVTEVYKSLNHIGPKIMEDMFTERDSNYNIRSGHTLELPNYSNYNRTFSVNTFDFRATVMWNSIPVIVKSQLDIKDFKLALNQVNLNCSCKICS